MNIAVIIAGGSGNRMGQDIPKQFIHIHDKPILIYTLEGFQQHDMIDAIEVVCIDGWEAVVQAYANQFCIDKLKWIVKGGNSAQESIRNGIYNLEGKASPEDVIIIHDGIRPMIDDTVLTDVIEKAQQYGNAVTSMPYNEQIFIVNPEDAATNGRPAAATGQIPTGTSSARCSLPSTTDTIRGGSSGPASAGTKIRKTIIRPPLPGTFTI